MELDKDGFYDANKVRYTYIENEGKYYHDQTEYEGNDPLHQTGLDGTTLNLYFKDATSIEAGKPYIIKWNKPNDYVAYNGENAGTCSDLVSPVFTGVSVEAIASTEVTSADQKVSFKGTYAPIEWNTENESILFLGVKNNKSALYYPQPDLTDPQNPKYPRVNAFHAYFQLNDGITVDDVTSACMFFDENEATGIRSLSPDPSPSREGSEEWYGLDGRKLSGKPNKPGLYINGDKKVVVM